MPLIDGMGDEVVHFAVGVIIVAVAALAWWSTNACPDRYRTVLVMRSHTHHPVTMSIRTGSPPPVMTVSSNRPSETVRLRTRTATGAIENNVLSDAAEVVPLQEMDSIIDAHMALLDNNRLRFYRRVDLPRPASIALESTSEEIESQEETEPASNAQIREMDSIVSAMEADGTTGCNVFNRPHENNSNSADPVIEKVNSDEQKSPAPQTEGNVNSDNEPTAPDLPQVDDSSKILIKLKYLNDTLKEVEGSLDELLKDFKWRHFSSELSAESRVRLIFNGRVLCDEGATLRALGLHHRAVVHCLVHPRRAPTQRGGGGTEDIPASSHEVRGERAQPERAWDLENILMTLVSVALTVVWFFRCEYSNMFTASASVALFGLTVFYSVAIFGLYLSDTFQIDRRQPQPVPNN